MFLLAREHLQDASPSAALGWLPAVRSSSQARQHHQVASPPAEPGSQVMGSQVVAHHIGLAGFQLVGFARFGAAKHDTVARPSAPSLYETFSITSVPAHGQR